VSAQFAGNFDITGYGLSIALVPPGDANGAIAFSGAVNVSSNCIFVNPLSWATTRLLPLQIDRTTMTDAADGYERIEAGARNLVTVSLDRALTGGDIGEAWEVQFDQTFCEVWDKDFTGISQKEQVSFTWDGGVITVADVPEPMASVQFLLGLAAIGLPLGMWRARSRRV
jgi:hypothetical protein